MLSGDTVVIPVIDVTADRLSISSSLAPGKVNSLSSNFIRSVNSGKLYDVLNMADGVYIKDYGYNTGIKTISLNSTQSEHTQIMFNGIKLNSSQNSMFDLSLLNTDDIEKIEILSGGSSALYGSEAVGGVINLVSERSNYKNLSINLSSGFGSFGFKKYHAGINGINGIFHYYLSGSYESSDNDFEFDYYDGFSTRTLKRADSRHVRNNLYTFITYKTKPFDINGYLHYNFLERKLPPSVASFSSLSSLQSDRIVISGISLQKKKADIKYNFNLDHKYQLQNYTDPNSLVTSTPINSFYNLQNVIHSGDITYNDFNKMRYFAGYEVSYNTMISNETENAKQIQAGFYSSMQYQPLKWLRVYPSFRFDHYSNIDKNMLSGKLGLNFNPVYRHTFDTNAFSIKTSIATNYRVPSFNDLYWKGLGNPELSPERSVSFDAGIYYNFNFYSVNTIELTYTHIDTKDRIVWNPDENGIWRPANIGRVLSRSFDISYRNKSENQKGLRWEFSINYNIASALKRSENYPGDPTYNKQMIYIPQELAKSYLLLEYDVNRSIINNISLNTFYTFTGKRFLDAENINFTKFYELLDANISFEINFFKVNSTVKFAVNNILNEAYEAVPGYPMPLRNYKVQLGFKY